MGTDAAGCKATGSKARALPAETNVERGTSQSKSKTSVNLSYSGYLEDEDRGEVASS